LQRKKGGADKADGSRAATAQMKTTKTGENATLRDRRKK